MALGVDVSGLDVDLSRCACCGHRIERNGADPWKGRLDGYCTPCAHTRCDAFPGECPRRNGMRHVAPHDLVGLGEIADRLGTARVNVRQWRFRGLLPEPVTTVSGTPVWAWSEILEWTKGPGRELVDARDVPRRRRARGAAG